MKKFTLIFGFSAIFIAALILALPEPIDNDLSLIGKDKKSVLFIYDLNLVVSNEQTIEINKAKVKLGDKVHYIVARTGYPDTHELMKKYQAQSAELLFFDERGELFHREFALLDASNLVAILANSA